jgi:hypothetical protein
MPTAIRMRPKINGLDELPELAMDAPVDVIGTLMNISSAPKSHFLGVRECLTDVMPLMAKVCPGTTKRALVTMNPPSLRKTRS